MKNYIYVFVVISLISCKTKYVPEVIENNYPDLINIIIDENTIEKDSLLFVIENISNENYFFPFRNLKYHNTKKNSFSSTYDNTELIITTENDKYPYSPYLGKSLVNYVNSNKLNKQSIKLDYSGIIKIKSKEKIKFKIQIPSSYYSIMKNSKNYFDENVVYYFGLQIHPMQNPHLITKISIDSLQQKSYKLYRKKINSNKIHFVVKDSISK